VSLSAIGLLGEVQPDTGSPSVPDERSRRVRLCEAMLRNGYGIWESLRSAHSLRLIRGKGSTRTVGVCGKRLLDMSAAAIALLALSPLILVVLLAIAVESRGPLFYRARRVGFLGEEFWMLKFRKMKRTANGLPLTLARDDRFTRVGRFLARSKLDEIPQFWNVLRGQMSLVGPRPEDPVFVAMAREEYDVITRVRPGVTGLSQLAFARESEILDRDDSIGYYIRNLLGQKVSLDRLYVQGRSLRMDLQILFWTAAAVILHRPVAVHRESGRLNVRRRPSLAVNASPPRAAHTSMLDDLDKRVNAHPTHAVNGANGNGCVDMKAVVLAGGRGSRLAPYASVLPKPLMPVGDRSVLEVVVGRLEESGIKDIAFCVGYQSHLIKAVFDARQNGHVKITYVQEEGARGTAGPLRLVDGLDSTFIAMNGDVLTTLDFGALVRHHKESRNALTIATQTRRTNIDYGVIHFGGAEDPHRIVGYEEKPELTSTVSMGIYVLEPNVLEHVPADGHFDFPDLVQELLRVGDRVGAYPFDGVWFDIGRREDYEQAVGTWLNIEPIPVDS
jgi:NDP-mannose synthase